MDLNECRKEIDIIDKQIMNLFQKRMKVSEEVAKSKINTGKKVYDKKREEEKLNALEKYAENDFNRQGIQELFSQIMSISRKKQYGMMKGQESQLFNRKDSISFEGNRIVYYGEPGTYTQQAMQQFFGKNVDAFNALTFREVMEHVKNGDADFGVLPIENSSTGGIDDNLDLLVEYHHYIVGGQVIRINHCLLGYEGVKLEEISKVYSHSQGLLQCKKYLEQYPAMERIKYMSTATCAKKVLVDADRTQAAIAGKQAADYYGLSILEENINYETNNSTRFIIIAKEPYYTKEADKICITFLLPHKSGSLYNILSHFLFNHINMSKIESRPIEGKNWEYRFFVEFEGNLKQASVINALNGIFHETECLRILGNYKMK